MFQSTILQNFVRKKLQDKLNSFFNLEASTIEGLTISNLGMKPKLIEELSHLIKIPLTLTNGLIKSVKLNISWENLLLASKESPIEIVISGIHLSARLPTELQPNYAFSIKKKIVEVFTQEFNKKTTSKLTFLNKLKEHFLGSISVEIEDLQIEMGVQMKHPLNIVLSVEHIKFEKDIKTDNSAFEMKNLSLGYRIARETKIEYLISNADLALKGRKGGGKDEKFMEAKNLEISFNNQNFNDIRRVIALIKWHNSFAALPHKLWKLKPNIIGEIEAKKKARYIGNIIINSINEKKKSSILETLAMRRKYIILFEKFRKDPSNIAIKNDLSKLEEEIDLWRILEYRKFCLLWAREPLEKRQSNVLIKKEASGESKVSWLSYWFPKSEQNELKEIENCIENTPVEYDEKLFHLRIEKVKIAVSIRSLSGKEPFINIILSNNEFYSQRKPVSYEHSELCYENVRQNIIVSKFVVEFDKYAGHHESHKYLISEKNNDYQGDDEFEDIENFVECEIVPNNTVVRVQPFLIKINEDILEKLSVFKIERIHNSFESAENLIFEENIFEEDSSKKNEVHNRVKIDTSIFISIPETMFEDKTEEIMLSFVDLTFDGKGEESEMKVGEVSLSAKLLKTEVIKVEESFKETGEDNYVTKEETVQLFKTCLNLKKETCESREEIRIGINFICIDFTSMSNLQQLIRLISKLKPKPKNKKPLYKMKNLRRKQSIGEEFIDACENLQEHLIKSATFSEKTKYERYIIKEKKHTKAIIELQGLKILLETSEISLSKLTVVVFQFSDYKSVSIDEEEKNLVIRIYNIKNHLKNVKEISKELDRMLKIKTKADETDKKVSESDLEGDILNLSGLNISIEVYYQNKLKILAEVSKINFEIQADRNIKAEAIPSLAFLQYSKEKKSKGYGPEGRKEHFLEPFKLTYLHEKTYNKDEKSIRINEINFNLKPTLFLELGSLFDELNKPEKLKIEIINSTANIINISTTGNIYKEYKPGMMAISTIPQCDIIMFGKKEMLSLSPESGIQKVELTKNLSLLKTMQTEYIFHLESNLRVTNKQENVIWVRVLTNRSLYEMRKNSMKEVGLITFEHLSTVQMSNELSDGRYPNLRRSTSLHAANKEDDDENSSDSGNSPKMKKATIVRTFANRNSNSFGNEIKAEKDTHQEENFTQHKNLESQASFNSDEIEIVRRKYPQPIISRFNSNQSAEKIKFSKEILLQPILPEQTIQLLLNSEEYYIEIIEYNKKGDIVEKYHAFKIKEVLEDGNQRLVHSYSLNEWSQESDEISSSLVISTNVFLHDANNEMPIYDLQVLSPVVMKNKMPMPISFSFSKEEIDRLEAIESAGRKIRKRSFQAIELEKVEAFKINRINKMEYKEISEIKINIEDYSKNFKLEHILENIREQPECADLTIRDLLCLNNGFHEIQMGIEIQVRKYIMRITIFPQFIFINMTQLAIKMELREENYTYPCISMNPLAENVYYKEFAKMSNEKLRNVKVLQHLFKEYQSNIQTFTGSFEPEMTREVRYGTEGSFNNEEIFHTMQPEKYLKSRQKIISYGKEENKIVLRKVLIDESPIQLLIFVPSLFLINKSDWSFFIKGEGKGPTRLEKNSTEYMLINDTIAVQACEEHEEIAYNEWMKIKLNTLGIIYYAKEMNSSSGYESREYELRKKRLKKAPKIFFRIVMTKYEFGYQILIEESQYPPVSFISRCKNRIQVRELAENIFEEMEMNEMAEYASKIPHHNPTFSLSKLENYEFKKMGEFIIDGKTTHKILENEVKVLIEEYKDKKIIIIEDYTGEDRYRSVIKNELLLEKVEKMVVIVNKVEISIMTNLNKELSCACLKAIQFSYECKFTKKFIKLAVANVELYSYNGLKPRYLFYCKNSSLSSISRAEVLNLFKRRTVPSELINSSISSANMNASFMNMNSGVINDSNSSNSSHSFQSILQLDLVVDIHKHATILEKCKICIEEFVVVLNANTIIDYLKYYSTEVSELLLIVKKHEFGRMILREIKSAISPTNKESRDLNDEQLLHRTSSISHVVNHKISVNTPRNKLNHKNSIDSTNANSQNNDDVDFMNKVFVIESFSWAGLQVTIKFENLENFHYFMSNKEIKYLIKFIDWIGDLRPIEFSPAEVEYEQYTLMKLVSLIDVNKLIKEISQTFLEYPLQEFYNILSFITKFIGFNDMEENKEQWKTLKKLCYSTLKMTKMIFSNNTTSPTFLMTQNGEMRENKKYVDRFLEESEDDLTLKDKIMKFKYEEWRYKEETRQYRLNTKVSRLERYNLPNQILPYESYKARIQAAINDQCGNKIFCQIKIAQLVNKDTIVGLTDDWFVLYMIEKEEWIVAKPEEVVDLYISKAKNKNKVSLGLNFGFPTVSKQFLISLAIERTDNKKMTGIQKYAFENPLITEEELETIKSYLNELKLLNEY